jgi:hypothetical protein
LVGIATPIFMPSPLVASAAAVSSDASSEAVSSAAASSDDVSSASAAVSDEADESAVSELPQPTSMVAAIATQSNELKSFFFIFGFLL